MEIVPDGFLRETIASTMEISLSEMSKELWTFLGVIAAAVVKGVFDLISKRMELNHARAGTQTVPSGSTSATLQLVPGAVNYALALR